MRAISQPRADDPRVVRSRSAAKEAARALFLRDGYVGTTMEDIADVAGLSKRTLYNIYADKDALFREIVADVITYAEEYARRLSTELEGIEATDLPGALYDLGVRLAPAILRPEVIALRRLLIGEARSFPDLVAEYYDRAPGRVVSALASGFRRLGESGLLRVADADRAAEQFAYLVVGAHLDRAILLGVTPTEEQVVADGRDGVETFLARFWTGP